VVDDRRSVRGIFNTLDTTEARRDHNGSSWPNWNVGFYVVVDAAG